MLLFDLDGTLIDSNGLWVDVDTIFLQRRGLEYTKEYYEGVAHTIFPMAAVFTKEYGNLPESCEEIMAEWMDLAKDAYAHVPLKPFVREYLTACRDRGERMAIVTSCVPEHCRTALTHHALTEFFEEFIFAHDLNMDKSDPALFLKTAEILGVQPEECTLYDDSVKSCRSARAAGMRVVGVYDPYFADTASQMPDACDMCIHSFEELL